MGTVWRSENTVCIDLVLEKSGLKHQVGLKYRDHCSPIKFDLKSGKTLFNLKQQLPAIAISQE